jgi:hypothetical protein
MKEGNVDCAGTLAHVEIMKEKGLLLEAVFVAKFISYVLCELSDADYESKVWRIADQSHWSHWNN